MYLVGAASQKAGAAKDVARALAEAAPPRLRFRFARTFCTRVVRRYWEELRLRPRQALRISALDGDGGHLRGDALIAADALGDIAASLRVDDAGYLVGSTYSAMLPDDFRSRNGVFYTPPPIVDRLLDLVTEAGIDWRHCCALDPACGGGAFLGPLARRMVRAMKGADRRVVLRQLASRLAGYELDSFAAWLSSVFLDATLNEELGSSGAAISEPIRVCDSLERARDEPEFDLVVGNPPYGRITLSPERRDLYRRSLFGHANLYGLFLDLALRRVKPKGVIAYVTPTGFLSGEYFKNLRALLGRDARPAVLDFISKRFGVFDDVLQETVLAVFRNDPAHQAAVVHFVEVAGGGLRVIQADRVQVPADARQPWIVARAPSASALAARLRSMPSRLADWGYGASTGPLVWNRYKDQLRHDHSRAAVPLVWAESVSADGEFSFRADRRNHAPYFHVAAGDEALVVRRPCVLVQRTTAQEQRRRLIAAELPQRFLDAHGGAVTVENHLNMLLPILADPVVDTRTLSAFLNSSAADRAFRCISGTVAVSAYELESMPLPPPSTMRGLAQLLGRPHDRGQVENYCNRLYGDA